MRRKRKAAGDVFEQKPKRFSLLPGLFDQHLGKLRIGDCAGCLYDQVALPAYSPIARSLPAVAIGCFKPRHGRSRHQKVSENSFVNDSDFLSRHAIVVEFVISIQVDTVQALRRRVINDGKEIGKIV
jgi:hypothetical protein